nr:Uncharacterized protein A9P81_3509 [Leptospira interrogans serovar Copenhageni/Icterohaemorrhagiae]
MENTILPFLQTEKSPGLQIVHSSLDVSGHVAITVTRSPGVVTFRKSTLKSASTSLAFPNGDFLVIQESFVEQKRV